MGFNFPMPELPEVETVVRQLQQTVQGKKIVSVTIHDPKVAAANVVKAKNSTIVNVSRRGKYILMELSNRSILLAHLRMTGHFQYLSQKKPLQKYCTALLQFNDGSALTHHDIRRFGELSFLSAAETEQRLSSLGPEPLAKNFTLAQFQTLFAQYPRAQIKTKLLDQSFLAGLGNIYAQEALYHAGIHPAAAIRDIPALKQKKLYTEIRRILTLAIEKNGTTVDNYAHLDGKGDFQEFLAVYQQTHCPKKHSLKFLRLGGRGTSYCPTCQK